MAGVTFRHVYKRFGDFVAVNDFSLDIEDGEFFVLLGPSGCGKTTALRMIAGLASVTEGEVLIGERVVTNHLPKYRDVAMVFQSYALYPHMTVAQNIEYPLKIRKIPEAERKAAVMRTAQQVQLDPLLDRLPKQLSGGQRQRVALARAIVRTPTVFLMDEPLSNLDAKLRGHMRAELKHLQHELGVTTVYVTHDQIEAMTLAARVTVMSEGVLQQLDTPKNIYNDPINLFVAGFIGSPSMNFFRGGIENGGFLGPGVAVPGVGGGTRGDVILGVRPEDLSIVADGGSHFGAPIYSIELIGDQTIVTARLGEVFVAIRADKDFDDEIGNTVHVRIDTDKAFLFAADTTERIRP